MTSSATRRHRVILMQFRMLKAEGDAGIRKKARLARLKLRSCRQDIPVSCSDIGLCLGIQGKVVERNVHNVLQFREKFISMNPIK